jgi:hypothetical protein
MEGLATIGLMHHGGGVARAALLATLVPALLALAACAPSGSSPPTSAATLPPPATQGSSPAPSLPSQTDTAWGRIWDAVPSTFPMIRGAVPATDTGEGAVSALLALQAPDAMVIAAFYRDALQAMSMTVTMDGPLEDGSVIVSGTDGNDCAVQVSVRPSGSTNLISVLYGAGCPY